MAMRTEVGSPWNMTMVSLWVLCTVSSNRQVGSQVVVAPQQGCCRDEWSPLCPLFIKDFMSYKIAQC